jgi:predicted Zn-dependent peptidase
MSFSGSSAIGSLDYNKERVALEAADQAFCALRQAERSGLAPLESFEEGFRVSREDADKLAVRNEVSYAVEEAGGRGLFATTAVDSTDFRVDLPSNEVELWFYLESERFLDPVFRGFYNEQQIVMDEVRLHESRPLNRLGNAFRATAYSVHPYRYPSAGCVGEIRNVSRPVAEAFFRRYYTPQNLTGVIVGDVDPSEMRELAAAYFGRITGGSGAPAPGIIEPAQTRPREVHLRLPGQSMVLIGYHIPGFNDPDYLLFEILGNMLSGGLSSRLYRTLVSEKQVAVKVQAVAGIPGQKYPNLFVFVVYVAPGQSCEEAEQALDEEIELLKEQPVNSDALEVAKQQTYARMIRTLTDSSGMASALAMYQTLLGDWRVCLRQVGEFKRVTAEGIQRCMASTFLPENRTVAVAEPE